MPWTCESYMSNNMVADDLAMQGARASVAMVLLYFARYITIQL